MIGRPTERERRGQESGFALLLVFAMAAAVALFLYRELPRVAMQAQRTRELALIERGEQYQRAIQLYVRKFRKYPASIEELENTNNVRFLRRRYKDPMTGKEEWRLIHMGPGGFLTDSLVHKPKEGQQPAQNLNTFISEGPALGAAAVPSEGQGAAALMRRGSDRPTMPPPGQVFDSGQQEAAQTPQSVAGQIDPATGQPVYPQPFPSPQAGTPYPGQQPYPGQPPVPGQPVVPGQPTYLGQQPYPGASPGGFVGVYPGVQQQPTSPQPGQFTYPPGVPQSGYPTQPGQAQPGAVINPILPFTPGQPNPYAYSQQPGQQAQPYQPPGYPQPQPVPLPAGYPVPTSPQAYPSGFAPGVGAVPSPSQVPEPSPGSQAFGPTPGTGQQGGQNQALDLIRGLLTQPRPGGMPGATSAGGQVIGAGIAGVASTLEAEGVKVYNERTKYNEWEFIYDFRQDQARAMAAAMPQQQGQQQPTGLSPQPGQQPGFNFPPGMTPVQGQSPFTIQQGQPPFGAPPTGQPQMGAPMRQPQFPGRRP